MIRTKKNGRHISLKADQERKRPGRRGVYDETCPLRAFKLCLLGLTNADLAVAFGISPAGIEKWLRDHHEFEQAVRAGKTEADANVAHKLYQRACGYEHEDVDIKAVPGVGVIKTKITKKYPPDATSAIFWLKNRTKKNVNSWADVNKIEHTGEVSLQQAEQLDLKEFTTEELRMIRQCGLKIEHHKSNGANVSNN